jgi:hypothetical protein
MATVYDAEKHWTLFFVFFLTAIMTLAVAVTVAVTVTVAVDCTE